jgi:hypothetical protein
LRSHNAREPAVRILERLASGQPGQ